MALEHAILVSLRERSATGYDLARRFDASIGHFWSATHQQIYKVLARMEQAGWVDVAHTENGGRRGKKTYSITSSGLAELTRWVHEPSTREAVRSDFTVKLRAGLDFDAIRADTETRLADHREQLAAYETSEKKFYPDPTNLTANEIGSWLALRGGLSREKHGIAWCEEILANLPHSNGETQ